MTNSIKSVLVTGGTGSFGKAFVRFLLDQPQIERVVVYSRGEHAQAAQRDALVGVYGLEKVRWMVGDVRDSARLERAFAGCDSVVHAAALKRIETGHYNPDEMVKTNVIGTMNVVEAAHATGVKRVVGLSSDKAYQPISPYGQSKALAESLLLAANNMHGRRGPAFSVLRYGNVTGSQGSVIPTWKQIIKNGGNVIPVSDMECTRFHMTIGEAVMLVWNLLLKMHGGELVIPDWLPAYRVGDLVEVFGVKADIKGLPIWEKKHESMSDTLCSATARRLTVDELKGIINA